MKKIDRETVQRILDAADIVEVVSDFVHLKRRGSSYLGLCPFHNERTPSFSVSKSKNICKCFSCGKGGSPVNFIMEHEQMSYYEALRYLARKYNIEIKEHEMSDKEREEESERESMLAVNDFALKHFEKNLQETDDGRDIGLSYFLDRGINEASIKKFRLGYSLEKSNDLLNAAKSRGYNEKYLIETGLCIKTDQGRVYDRFKGRVMFPVFSISGKVIAFGGRTLKKDVAKYVNSPESLIYKKSYQLYGLYQAKQAIVKHDKCILVEGYMDVISMHQSGIENVVASSGTSLTDGQIRLIHRFTDNVTVIYDGDAAGIKASLRGIDMLLAEGLDIKVLLLPDGDDPDSFAQKHTSSELEEYIAANETDFLQFKTSILLNGVKNDPIAKSRVINDIVRSIAVIPNPITRNVYITECSRMLEIDDRIVALQVNKLFMERVGKDNLKKQQEAAAETISDIVNVEEPAKPVEAAAEVKQQPSAVDSNSSFLRAYEQGILRYVLRYGMLELCEDYDDIGNPISVKVIDYVNEELKNDDLKFSNPDIEKTFEEAIKCSSMTWEEDNQSNNETLLKERERYIAAGEEEIRTTVTDLNSIAVREKELVERADQLYFKGQREYGMMYIEKILCSHPDDSIRNLTLELVSDKHTLSKVHTKYAKIETDEDRLPELVPRSIYEFKDAILECRIRKLHDDIKAAYSTPSPDKEVIRELMERHVQLQRLRGEFAKFLGERIINPRK